MSNFGQDLSDSILEIEDGTLEGGSVYFKTNSRDFRRIIGNLARKIDSMQDAFEYVGEKILEVYIQHFINEEGPDQSGNLIQWPDYNVHHETGEQEYRKRKARKGYSYKLLVGKDESIEPALTKGGPGNIFNVSKFKLEVGIDIPHYGFHHQGFNVVDRNGQVHHGPEDTQRPIVGLTDDEQEEIMDDFMKEFFKDL